MLNLDEVIGAMSDSINVLITDEFVGEDEDAKLFADIMKELYSTDALKDEMVRDIYNYHYYFGNIMPSDTVVYYKDELDNKIGGQNIPLSGTVTIATDRNNQTIQIDDTKIIDQEKSKEAIEDALDQVKVKKKKKIAKEIKASDLDIIDIENYTYDFQYGWLKYYERNRIFTTEEGRNERFVRIRAVE